MALSLPQLRSHLLALGLTCGVGVTGADGAIVAVFNANIVIPSNALGVYLNVITGQAGTTFGTIPAGWDVNIFGSTTFELFSPTPAPGGGAYVGSGSSFFNSPVSFGTFVGPGDSFCSTGIVSPAFSTPLNLNSDNNGLEFRFINESTGLVHYGALRFGLSGSAGAQPRTILDYFYESEPGVPLRLPTPGAATALLLASAATLRRRHRIGSTV